MENKSILAQLLADQPERTAPGSYLDPAMWGRLNLDSPVTHGLAGALRGLYGVVDFPRQYMQGGIDREAATDWAAPMALNMVGAPQGAAGGIGSGMRNRGGKSLGLKAAVRDPETGQVYVGPTHMYAIETAPQGGGVWGRLWDEWDRSTDNSGFVDASGKFMSRTEAEKLLGVSTMEDVRDIQAGKKRGR